MDGSAVYNELKSSISKLERECSVSDGQISRSEAEITLLMNEREQCYSSLAVFYLPELDAESVKKTLKEVQEDVKKVFAEKQAKRAQLDESISRANAKRVQYEITLETVTEALNCKSAEKDEAAKKVAQALSEDPAYRILCDKTRQSEEKLKRNKERVAEVEAMAKEKLPAYTKNKIFVYLLGRNFGTAGYDASGLSRVLDEWAAKKINYESAKKDYDFLISMPQQMGEEVKRRESEFEKLLEQVRAKEKAAADSQGLTKIIEDGEALLKKRDEAMRNISAANAEIERYGSERKDAENTKGSHHVQAVAKLKEFLKGTEIESLRQKAMGTKAETDDDLVTQIETIDSRVRSLKDTVKSTRRTADEKRTYLTGLKRIQSKFSSSDYESSRSYFDSGFNINSLLVGYIAGRMSEGSVWGRIESAQHFRPRQTYNYSPSHTPSYGGSSRSSWSSHSSGSGFGGGRFSSGKGF